MTDPSELTTPFHAMRETAARYYDERLRTFGPGVSAVDWKSEESQTLRFEQLLRLIDQRELMSVNDYGCGDGALASYLRRRGYGGHYTGLDISEAMVGAAVAAHRHDPLSSFTSRSDTLAPADYTIASGVFNVKQEHEVAGWQEYVLATLADIDRVSRRGFAFNMLSSYSDADRRRPDLFYATPGLFFDYCKAHFSPRVALLHDYPLYEFTIVVRK
jgi:SAM-dependent methyltransferase